MKNLKIIFTTLLFIALIVSCKKSPGFSAEFDTKGDSVVVKTNVFSDKQCFQSAINKDTTSVTLTFEGDSISGTMDVNPYQKDRANGTLLGKKEANGELNLVYSYMIEGNNQTETKVMKIENNLLLIKHGALTDEKNDGNLKYKNAAEAKYSETIPKIDCK